MTENASECRMVAEPRLTMRECTRPAMEDRETVDVYDEERETDNVYKMDEEKEIDNEYRMIEEIEEAMDDNEDKQQTLRLCSETDDVTVAMIKMNIKLPTPTQYDGKSLQFNEWAEEVESYLTVHNIYINNLLEDSVRSQVPMVIATMQRDAVANDLQSFNARCPQQIRYGEDHYDDYMDRWEAMEKKKADILQLSQTLNY
eukprot:5759226-Amphidinium_carterae.1